MHPERFSRTLESVHFLAIFVIRTDAGTHTGILHRSKNLLNMIDQMWHERLRSRPVRTDDSFSCVIPDLEPEEINDVTGICRLIEARMADPDPVRRFRIPYALRYGGARFEQQTGNLNLGAATGLTCSTFVLSVFDSASVPLVDLTDWKSRPEDRERHQQLITAMEAGGASPDHISTVRAEVDCARVRPEEVAGCGLADSLPARFDEARFAGEWILTQLP